MSNYHSVTWGSKPAEDTFTLATRLAGFDRHELMLEITRLQGRRLTKVNETTVIRAIQSLS